MFALRVNLQTPFPEGLDRATYFTAGINSAIRVAAAHYIDGTVAWLRITDRQLRSSPFLHQAGHRTFPFPPV